MKELLRACMVAISVIIGWELGDLMFQKPLPAQMLMCDGKLITIGKRVEFHQGFAVVDDTTYVSTFNYGVCNMAPLNEENQQ